MSHDKTENTINAGIKNGATGKLNSNQDVRKYAHDTYKEAGLTNAQIKSKMAQKDAFHIIAKK